MLQLLKEWVNTAREYRTLPAACRREFFLPHPEGNPDPGPKAAALASLDWLCDAQDRSATADGGVSHRYSLDKECWASSYPETTGYIVPTFLAAADLWNRPELKERARRMTDWLASIQLADHGFQGGLVDATPCVAVSFNTGQILFAFVAAYPEFGDQYRDVLLSTAHWLCRAQDEDGCWRRYPSPFVEEGEKTYETHVAWPLAEAGRLFPNEPFSERALRNVRWALEHQNSNAWFRKCCLQDEGAPLTHTIGYVVRGVLEVGRLVNDKNALAAGQAASDALIDVMDSTGFIPGRLASDWRSAASWSCLTGTAQIALCWFLLYRQTGDKKYLDAAKRANGYLRRTVSLDGSAGVRGGVRGSYPGSGMYGRFQMLNWAAKFFIDSQMEELALSPAVAPHVNGHANGSGSAQ